MPPAIPPYDPELQAIAAYAAETLGAPVALVSALGEDRQSFVAEVGFGRSGTALEESFCAHAVRGEGLFEVPDAQDDPRFADNPLVTGGPRVRFYAGVPVASADGVRRGALCVLDTQPRTLTDAQRRTLAFLARQTEARLELLDRVAQSERAAKLLELVTDRLPVRVAYVDREFRFRFMNDAYERIAGLTRERALGRTVAEATNEGVFRAVRANLERALGGETHTDEFDAPYDGGTRRVQVTYVPDVPPEGGLPRGVVVQAIDRTEQRAAERAVADERARLDRTLDTAEVATFDWDVPRDRVQMNGLMAAFYGMSNPPEGLPIAPFYESVHPDDRAALGAAIEASLATGRRYEAQYRVRGEGGRERWVLARGDTVRDDAGRPLRLSGVLLDVTARAAVEAERERLLAEVEIEQAKLRSIFEQAPAFIAVLRGRDLVFDYVNQGYYAIVGHRPLLGLPLVEAIPEVTGGDEAGRDYDRLLLGVMDSGERLTFSERPALLQRTADGPPEERFLDLAYLPLREVDGTVSGVLVHGIDVTEGVVARRAIREREELFRTVFEQAPDDAILVMDRDRTLTAWNPAAERITGWTAAEAIGQPADLIFTPEDVAKGLPAQETEGAARQGKAEDERWHLRRDGTRFWGSGTMNSLHDAEGNVRGFLKVFRDATVRYEEARALAFLRRFTDAIVDTRDPDEILSTTERMLGEHLAVERVAFGDISEAGATATVARDWTNGLPSVVGTYRVADFSPQIVWNLAAGLPHVSRDSERDYAPGVGLEAVRALGARASVTTPILKDGRLVSYLLVHSAAPRDWTEDEIGLVKQVADRVTAEIERARAEAALREANRTLEARVEARTEELRASVREAEGFNYSISHDLRTPLRAVVMTASVLLEEAGPELDEEQRDLLRRQVHNANRMGQLIDELLRLSRLARAPVVRRPLDMTAEARAVAEEIETGCAFEVQEGMVADGDEGLVRTVLVNLLENACKFSPAGGTVRMGRSDGAFFVRDEGVGFDMQFAPKIFLPFERLVTEREFPGTGIGLANVKRIVERHGGRVWAESEPGQGATFFFTLAPNSPALP